MHTVTKPAVFVAGSRQISLLHARVRPRLDDNLIENAADILVGNTNRADRTLEPSRSVGVQEP